MQVIVLGMHRSGTSAVTRLLNMAGCWFGPEGISTDANEENPKGFWERRDVRKVCDALLQGSGFDWWKIAGFTPDAVAEDVRLEQVREFERIVLQMDAHRPWVLKEPRLCLLLPVLRSALELPVCVMVSREPLEVARSLRARDEHMPVPAGLALWELYTRAAFGNTADLPRVHVAYADVLADPVGTTARLLDSLRGLGVEGLRQPGDQEITAFVTPDLQRQREAVHDRSAYLNGEQTELAATIDDGSILDAVDSSVSTGAVEVLRWLERDADDRNRAHDLTGQLRDAERSAAATVEEHERREQKLERAVEELEEQRSRATELTRTRLQELEGQLEALRATSTWRVARRAQVVLGLLRGHRPGEGPMGVALRNVRTLQSDLRTIGRTSDVAPSVRRSRPPAAATARASVAVLAWDVGHNPLGRANVLAEVLARHFDVEIWGAQFERYGSRIWAPMRDVPTPVNVFTGRPFPNHLAVMEQIAEQIEADAIYVSKPRLPSYLLGVLAKEKRNRPLVLDVDDHELAFFAEDEGIDVKQLLLFPEAHDLSLPFERAWTRAAESAIAHADQVTVSNVALQERYGGVLVPHARDERTFDPELYDREAIRRRIGVSPDQKLLLFGGTPRVHKGVIDVLQALDRLGDPSLRLLVFGTREFNELRKDIGPLERWAIPLPYQLIGDLPALVGAADLACVLQDPAHPVSRYQMPAKVTDALAMGVPCLVHPVPPLQGLIDDGILLARSPDEPLDERLAEILAHPDDARERAKLGRERFLTTYSYEAVGERLAPLFEGLMNDPPPLGPGLSELATVPRRLFADDPGGAKAVVARPGPSRPARAPGASARARVIASGEPFDVVMFWKQNDTGIYGRRQDMFLKYLACSPRVGTIVHFDNPVSPELLVKTYRKSSRRDPDQNRLVVRQTLGRLARRFDAGSVYHHTFVHGGPRSARAGLPPRSGYPAFVRSVLGRRGIGTRPWVLWAYPSNPDLPALIDGLEPDLVVADVVDDNRTWFDPGSPQYDRVDVNYEEVLGRSDLILANCDPVAEAMQRFTDEIHVVPNGLELTGGQRGPRPRELRRFTGPIIGYVGNLSHRIDIDLLDHLALQRPTWQFVFVGSAHLDKSILRLGRRTNVHFLGVKPYLEALELVRHFDVALIPHLDNEMTRAMNPLKAYVYCAEGVPVVSTPIANLGALEDTITIAEGPDQFLEAIESALRSGHVRLDPETLRPHSWEQRIERVLELIDSTVSR